jgi:hypothetical protein
MSSNAQFGPEAEIVDFAYGSAKTVHVFGIGGLNTESLVKDAKANMYAVHPLAKGQAYANLSVDFATKFFFFVVVTKVKLSADIIETGSERSNKLQEAFKYSPLASERILGTSHPLLWALNSDSLLALRNNKCLEVEFIKMLSENEVMVNGKQNDISWQQNEEELFVGHQEKLFPKQEFKLGDEVFVKIKGDKNETIATKGRIIGVNPKKVLIETDYLNTCLSQFYWQVELK